MRLDKVKLVMYPVLAVSQLLRGLVRLGLWTLAILSPLRFKPCLADLDEQFACLDEAFPAAILSCFVLKELKVPCGPSQK